VSLELLAGWAAFSPAIWDNSPAYPEFVDEVFEGKLAARAD
jgi:hypothetical protein